ncbi:MAG: DUF4276 family protein [bacterium]
MNRLIIICEGETELEFCKNILKPYFLSKNIEISYPKIKHSNGGIVSWSVLKKQLLNHLLKEKCYVTLFIDLYGIKDSYKYPSWEESKTIVDKNKRIGVLEQAMLDDIPEKYKRFFIPYIQLHEFEVLLFYDFNTFENNIPSRSFVGREELEEVLAKFPNSEMINETITNSPSHRLKRIISGYDKVLYSYCIASEIGLANIRSKCTRFDMWIERLERISFE